MCTRQNTVRFSFSDPPPLPAGTKFYAVDAALARRVGARNDSSDTFYFENLVFQELLARGDKVYYWQSEKGFEIDFVVETSSKKRELIQVCWSLQTTQTVEREVRSFNAFCQLHENLQISEKRIITFERTDIRAIGDVLVTPFYAWALTE